MRHCLNIYIGAESSELAIDVHSLIAKNGAGNSIQYLNTMSMVPDAQGAEVTLRFTRCIERSGAFTTDMLCPLDITYEDPIKFSDSELGKGLADTLLDYRSRTITINNPGDNPHLLLSVCLFASDEKACKLLDVLTQALSAYKQQFDIDVILLSDEVRRIAFDIKGEASNNNLRVAAEHIAANGGVKHIIAIDNNNNGGLAVNFDREVLPRLLNVYTQICIEQYATLYNLADDLDREHPVVALGMSVLEFDRYLFINYLLTSAYLQAMHNEHVEQDKVDINNIAKDTDELVKKYQHYLPEFWEEHIHTQIIDKVPAKDIAANADQLLNQRMEEIETTLQAFLLDPNTSLPHKQAMMAMLLGEDDNLLTGYLFNEQQHYIEDLDTDAFALFKTIEEDIPIEKLRKLKFLIRESVAFLRDKTLELDALDEQMENADISQRRLTEEGFTYGGVIYKLVSDEVVEVPLSETYEPHPVNEASVDLRPYCTPIRNQGQQGSCTAHAGVAVIEYLLKKNNADKVDMSEAFVYYNTRRRAGDEKHDNGCTISDLMFSMQEFGVCEEELCRYDENNLIVNEPSKEAYDNGALRRVTGAKNVRLKIDDFKSALTDGMPIVISMRIYDNFEAPGGFVNRPVDKNDKWGGHAVIVVGYSDAERIFIVRNSWGEGFGDKGYCYIPYTFVEGEGLINMAAVITGTSITEAPFGGDIHGMTVTFDHIDATIRRAILQNIVYDEQRKLNGLTTQYNAARRQYEALAIALGNNSERRKRIANAKEAMQADIDLKKQQLEELHEQCHEELKKHDAKVWAGHKKYATAAISLLLGILGLSWLSILALPIIGWPLLLLAINLLIWWLHNRYWNSQRRAIRARYDSLIARNVEQTERLRREMQMLDIRGQIYGMAIDKATQMHVRLKKKYRALCSYVGNLKVWMKEEQSKASNTLTATHDPFISVIDKAALDRFFDSKREELTRGIRLYDFLSNYTLDDDGIVAFKQDLKQRVAIHLQQACEDFSMLRYTTGLQAYPYLPDCQGSLSDLLGKMSLKGELFLPIRTDADDTPKGCMLYVHAESQDERNQWHTRTNPRFSMPPMQCDYLMPTVLVLLHLRRIAARDIK